jgi:hypothetical protein
VAGRDEMILALEDMQKQWLKIDQASMYVTQFHLAITNKDLLSKTNKESIETIEK